MRVFVLGTGRNGSTTFARAAGHASNFTAAHESRVHLAVDRLAYPDGHIEADNRLSWFLGSLGRLYPDAYFVHLIRDEDEVVASFRKRFNDARTPRQRFLGDVVRTAKRVRPTAIMDGFAHTVLIRSEPWSPGEVDEVTLLYCRTVNDNIADFVADRPHMTIDVASAVSQFPAFWDAIGAEGDLSAAVGEWSVRHNASEIR